MHFPLITVIVPTFRKFDNLQTLVNSIFGQDYPNIELIISDDGSEEFDSSYIQAILRKRPDNIKMLSVIHHPINVGTVKNLNYAIKNSHGDYVFLIGQDDSFVDRNVFEKIRRSFGEALVVTGIKVLYSEDKNDFLGEEPLRFYWPLFDSRLLYRFLAFSGNIICGACTYYKREAFIRYGLFDERFRVLEDFPFYLLLLRQKERIKFIELKTTKYSLGGISSGGSCSHLMQNDLVLLFEREIKCNKGIIKRGLEFKLKLYKQEKLLAKAVLFLCYLDIFLLKLCLLVKLLFLNLCDKRGDLKKYQ